MSYFPIIKTPQEIKQIQCAFPSKIPFTESPPIQSVEEPQKYNLTLIFLESVLAFTIIPIISQSIPTIGFFLFILAIGTIAIQTWLQYESYPNRLQKYRYQVKDYNTKLLEYKDRKHKHEQEQKIAQSPARIARWRREQMSEILKYTTPHDGNRSSATKGFSEEKFKGYLNQYFSNKIHTGLTLKFSDSYHPYAPDFTYIDREINLYVDIEIDEPYVYHTGQPTHFQGAWKDDKRNNFFNEKLWAVIRFSEEQVVCYPHSCCKTIAREISQIIQDDSVLNQFANIPDLQEQKQWTEAEATEMAQQLKRDKYKPANSNLNKSSSNKINSAKCTSKININDSNNSISKEQAKKTIRRRFRKYLKKHNLKRNKIVKKQFIEHLKTSNPIELANWLKQENNSERAMSFIANIGQESK